MDSSIGSIDAIDETRGDMGRRTPKMILYYWLVVFLESHQKLEVTTRGLPSVSIPGLNDVSEKMDMRVHTSVHCCVNATFYVIHHVNFQTSVIEVIVASLSASPCTEESLFVHYKNTAQLFDMTLLGKLTKFHSTQL